MNRRGFLRGMAGILASGIAPAAIGSGVLMPVRTIWRPDEQLTFAEFIFHTRVGPYDEAEQQFFDIMRGAQWSAEQIAGMPRVKPRLILNRIK